MFQSSKYNLHNLEGRVWPEAGACTLTLVLLICMFIIYFSSRTKLPHSRLTFPNLWINSRTDRQTLLDLMQTLTFWILMNDGSLPILHVLLLVEC